MAAIRDALTALKQVNPKTALTQDRDPNAQSCEDKAKSLESLTFQIDEMVVHDNQVDDHHVNPIRRVVTLLQDMAKKITEEDEQEEAMYKNFECYYRTTSQKLEDGR